MPNIKPAFQVKRRENIKRTVVNYRYVKAKGETRGRFVREEVTEVLPEVFDVYFAQGHSIRVDSREQLQRLNLGGDALLIDFDTGDVVPHQHTLDLERHVIRNTRNLDHFNPEAV